jgi:trimethylamine:corrinoid methyltransferase-like protein
MVQEGVRHSFMGIESTLDNYRRLYWYPQLFDRRSLGEWLRAGSPLLLDRARDLYRQHMARPD